MEVSGQPHVPVALPLKQDTLFPWNGRLDGLHSQSDLFGEENIFPLPGVEFLIFPPYKPVAVTTTLFRSLLQNERLTFVCCCWSFSFHERRGIYWPSVSTSKGLCLMGLPASLLVLFLCSKPRHVGKDNFETNKCLIWERLRLGPVTLSLRKK